MSSENPFTLNPTIIVMYSKSWCPDCRRARKVITESKVPFIELDVTNDEKARAFVREINKGNESVPTIIFPDGSILVEPGNSKLSEKIQSLNSLSAE
jgi:mycoredoxin